MLVVIFQGKEYIARLLVYFYKKTKKPRRSEVFLFIFLRTEG